MGRYEDALRYYLKALELKPADSQIHANLGVALLDLGRATEAVSAFKTALELNPANAGAARNLGNAYLRQGRGAAALDSYRDALQKDPADRLTHSNLLCALNNAPEYAPAHLADLARDWWRQHGHGIQINNEFSNPVDPNRRLRVGYVSPDFRQHSVSYFFAPLLQAHNRGQVDVFCYGDVPRSDRITRRLRDQADHWRDIVGLSDGAVYEQIRNDQVDILVDLAGHTSGNRLAVFARRPAPIQVTWLGYPNTTGIPAIHYRFTDAVADPPGDADRFYSEELIRLPHGFLCYQPPDACPDVSPLPALSTGRVTFGSFNNIAKINTAVIRTWAAVLRAVPRAQLLLKSKQLGDKSVRTRLRKLFAREGILREQLEMLPFALSTSEHMAVYHRVDAALDTFPYNGTTTTCEALWMGVPVITLLGDRHAARVGASLLTRIGCPELIAATEQAYVEQAVRLASDLKTLSNRRKGLRARLRSSPLCDSAGFAAGLEDVYQQLWGKWCRRCSAGNRSGSADAERDYHRGLERLAAGDLESAARSFEHAIAIDPACADAYYNLGAIRQQQARLAEAVAAYEAAEKLDPQNAETHYNLGSCWLALQQPDNARQCYRRAIRLNPTFTAAHNNLGLALKNVGRLDEAVQSFQQAIELDPAASGYHQNLGLTFHQQTCHLKAIASFQRALDLEPDSAVIRFNLAASYAGAGNHQQAARQLAGAVELDPDFGEAYHNLGDILGKLGKYAEAAENFRQAVRVNPKKPAAWNGLGNALTNLGSREEAVDCYHRAIALRPDYAGAHLNLGTWYYQDRQLDQAEKQYRRALDIDAGLAEAEFNLGLVHLLRGDLQKGWPGYEKRFDKPDWPTSYPFRLDRPMWNGRPFKGQTLLVHDEQGLGDTLQFVRYLEMVKPLGGEVLLETRPPLIELLKEIRGADRVIARSRDGRPSVAYDLCCPLLSLPHIFSTTLDTIPARVPYIHPDIEKADRWAARMDSAAFNVGLVWSGNPTHFRGRNRSAALADFNGVLRTPGVRFYGFQTGAAAREAEAFAAAGLLENLGAEFADFSDTAAAMAHMDLVISIDTSVAHLAGAMGKPVWLLLAYAADWRWFLERSDSPWYPTMRLFCQQRKGGWTGVIATVKGALKKMLAKVE